MRAIFMTAALCLGTLTARAGEPQVYGFDLRGSAPGVSPSTLKLGDTRGPAGRSLGLNSYYFLRDGKPWLPVMGEMHYSRYPRQYWEEALLKMEAGGIDTVATYVFWNHHEPAEGAWNWSGNRSLREFLQLCAKHGLYAFVRLGPWSHGEARNGGHPDWLLAKGVRLRSTDPRYLAYTHKLYEQIYAQCRGLLFKEGGPVIGVQVDNEVTEDPEYLHALKRMAREVGFNVPFYTATAWMAARLPDAELLSVWAAYADMPWEDLGRNPVPPRKQYLFTSGLDLFDQRTQDAPGAGLDLDKVRAEHLLDKAVWLPQGYPYAMAELGGGIQIVHDRRPVLTASDVAALAYVSLGKGANLLGYYMYHGGSQPLGLQEPGLPPVSYDFQAPLGEFGYARESYHYLRALHLFAEDFAAELAPAFPVLPSQIPAGPADNSVLRSIVRTAAGKGFLFWSNHHREVAMRDLGPLRFSVETPDEKMVVPDKAVTIPKGAFGIWPLNLSLGDTLLQWATVQPLSIIRGAGQPSTYFFFASDGIAPEYFFSSAIPPHIETNCGTVVREGSGTRVSALTPGPGCVMTAGTVRVVTLTSEQSRRFWKTKLAGAERAVLAAADVQFNGHWIVADSIGEPTISVAVYPPLELRSNSPLRAADEGIFRRYTWNGAQKTVAVGLREDRAGHWSISFAADAMQGLSDVILSVNWVGDVVELRMGATGALIADDFYTGREWQVGLKRFVPDILQHGATIGITPLRKDANIFLERWPPMSGDQVLELKSVKAVPVYRAVFSSTECASLAAAGPLPGQFRPIPRLYFY